MIEYITEVTRREAGIHPERVHTVTCGATSQNPVFMLWDYITQGKRWNHWNHFKTLESIWSPGPISKGCSTSEPWPTMSPWLPPTIFDSVYMERVAMSWLYWFHIQTQLHLMSMHFLCFVFSSETDEIYKFISSQKLLLPSRHIITAAILSQVWSVEVAHGKVCSFHHCTSHYMAFCNIWLLFM